MMQRYTHRVFVAPQLLLRAAVVADELIFWNPTILEILRDSVPFVKTANYKYYSSAIAERPCDGTALAPAPTPLMEEAAAAPALAPPFTLPRRAASRARLLSRMGAFRGAVSTPQYFTTHG